MSEQPQGQSFVLPKQSGKNGAQPLSFEDRNFALSIRLLTLLITAALGASIAFLAYRCLSPAPVTPSLLQNERPN